MLRLDSNLKGLRMGLLGGYKSRGLVRKPACVALAAGEAVDGAHSLRSISRSNVSES